MYTAFTKEMHFPSLTIVFTPFSSGAKKSLKICTAPLKRFKLVLLIVDTENTENM